jgi:nicotinate dehydrogenase subunit A
MNDSHELGDKHMNDHIELRVNGARFSTKAAPQSPLLYVLRNDAGLNGPRFGCGLGQCGACTVLVDGVATRSCVTPVGSVEEREITALEGIGSEAAPHALQKAFIAEQAAQCGYCTNGMLMTAKALLDVNPKPSEEGIRLALANNLCRCGTHLRIIRAVLLAASGQL